MEREQEMKSRVRTPWMALNMALAIGGLLALLTILGYCGVAAAQ